MKPKKRQKLCYNCEGEVDLDVIVCPFCAADLRAEKPELDRSSFSPAITTVKQLNTQHSLYPAPYQRGLHQEEAPIHLQEAPPLALPPEEETEAPRTMGTLLTALVLFTLGVHLFLLGVLLVIFSDRGVLLLKWDATLWFLYIFASIPLLLFGYRYLNKI